MKFKFRKKVNVKLRSKINATEFILTVDYKELKEEDFGFFTSYLNKSIDKLSKNLSLIDGYKVGDYLRLQFDSAYCKLYDIEPLEVEEIINSMANIKPNSLINEGLTLKQVKEKYLEDLKLNRELKDKTISTYSIYFNHIINFFSESKIVKEITAKDITKFNSFLSNKVKITVRRDLMTFYKNLFEFLILSNDLEKNYFKLIKFKNVKSDKRAYANKEVLQILKGAEEKQKFKKPDNDLNLTIKLGAYCGFRIEEVANIKIKDINLKHNSIYISLKNTTTKRHQRIVPIHKDLLDLIKLNIMTKDKNDFLVYDKL